MLDDVRVLDLTDQRGLMCGAMLAQLGADVIAVEPPDGNPARRLAPFTHDSRGLDASLVWQAHAAGRRSVLIDLDQDQGRKQLDFLIRSADILVESGGIDGLPDYAEASRLNPGLIYVSISAFGSDGPKAGYAATDLTVSAASGTLAITGDRDRPPLRIGVPQAFLHAGAEAAAHVLVALEERQRSGRGQHLDVSAQVAMASCTQSLILADAVGAPPALRSGIGTRGPKREIRLYWPAVDGHVAITLLFGQAIGPFTRRLMEWVYEAGYCDEATRDKDWIAYTTLLSSGEEPFDEYVRVCECIALLTRSKTRRELFEEAARRRLLIAPVNSVAEVVESEQLKHRGYWETRQVSGQAVRVPGAFAEFDRRRPGVPVAAPQLGQHTEEVLKEWSERSSLPARGAPDRIAYPLEGLKVLDLMWVLAGPVATRALADFGATVVRVESGRRLDTARTLQPFVDGRMTGLDASALFHNVNANKLMITLDPTMPEGREVILDLVRWADVVAESFSPGVLESWDLSYDTLRQVNPQVVMASSSLMGQTGPLTRFAGFGTLAAAVSGFTSLAGWPDRPPAGPYGAYTDYVSPKFLVAAFIAALRQRRRTGLGTYVDLSQVEASVHFLAPAVLDYEVNGHVWRADGNRDLNMAPHGVYQSAGDDEWIALACRDDADWNALLEVIGDPVLSDPRFRRAASRMAVQDDIDTAISRWTRERSPGEAEDVLQAKGIPAHAVLNGAGLTADPQLQHLGHFNPITSGEARSTIEAPRVRFSRTPGRRATAVPTMGRDTLQVLTEFLGYTGERIAELTTTGAIT